jgi:hypothetical protein
MVLKRHNGTDRGHPLDSEDKQALKLMSRITCRACCCSCLLTFKGCTLIAVVWVLCKRVGVAVAKLHLTERNLLQHPA